MIGGPLNLTLLNGTLTLSGINTYTGNGSLTPIPLTTITGGTLALSGAGALPTNTTLVDNGIFDITQVTGTTPVSIGNLTGNGIVSLGDKELMVTLTSDATFNGTLTGAGGSLDLVGGAYTLLLTKTGSDYSGTTTVTSGTLQAGIANAFSPASNYDVTGGTLDLNGNNNVIYSLQGLSTGIVTDSVATPAILTIRNGSDGGNYAGALTGTGFGLNLIGGILDLKGTSSSYGGPTTVSNANLIADAPGSLSQFSPVTLSNGAILTINASNTILSLTGDSTTSVPIASSDVLTIKNGGAFAGGITGQGGLSLTGGTLILSTPSAANTYFGTTILSNAAVLQAGALNAFSPNSPVNLTGTSTLNLNGYSNTIFSLTGNAGTSVKLGTGGILTINGGATTTYSGSITDAGGGGLTIGGGSTQTLNGTPVTYSGPTVIQQGTLNITANGSLSPYTDVTIERLGTLNVLGTNPGDTNSANSILNSGTLHINEPITLNTTYTQTAGGTLDLDFNANNSTLTGQIIANDNINLSGALFVNDVGTPKPTMGVYPILQSLMGRVFGQFTSFTYANFDPSHPPSITYTPDQVDLFFSGCNQTWIHPGNGNWNVQANWSGNCVPGVNGNINDVANFINLAPSAITVLLADSTGTMPQPIILFQLNLNASSTQYTIQQFSPASTITLDSTSPSGIPTVNVLAGTATINAPIILNKNSIFFLTDGTQLNLGTSTTVTSFSNQSLTILESLASTASTGLLVNNGTIDPYSLIIGSASVINNTLIQPINSLTIAPQAGDTVTVTNAGTTAIIGTSGGFGTVTIGGAGTTSISNTGIDAIFGPTGVDSIMTVGSTGMTTVVNSGIGSQFGPTAPGSTLTVSGSGTTTITNTGTGTKFGTTGTGSNVFLSSGTITNSSGATIQAGNAGTLTINGSTIINDATSVVGSATANLIFSSGFLNTTGLVLANDYTQNGTSVLRLNFTPVATQYGHVVASGTASVGSSLIVNADSATFTSGEVIDLVTAPNGVTGTYSSVTFLNFPVGTIPAILYTPTAVELVFSPTVGPTPVGTLTGIAFASVNESNLFFQRELYELHKRIRQRDLYAECCCNPCFCSNCCYYDVNASKAYFIPIDRFGSFKTQNVTQTGFRYNSEGFITGVDHAFKDFGLGFAAEYTFTRGHVKSHSGRFDESQLLLTGYGAWVPEDMNGVCVDLLAGFGYDWYHTHRVTGPVPAPVTARSKPTGVIGDVLFGAEYILGADEFCTMPCNLLVTPYFNGQWIYAQVDGYSERGASIYGLHVGRQSVNSYRTTFGTRFEYTLGCENFLFTPELDLAWQYEYLDNRRCLHFSTISLPMAQSIRQSVLGAGRNTFLLGVDFLFTVCKVFELELIYDMQLNDVYQNNSFYISLGGNF